jgi:hypothetical protein
VGLLLGQDGQEGDDSDDPQRASPRLGALLNYSPTRILYVSEPFRNAIAALDLIDDGVIFRVARVRRCRSAVLSHPVDLARAVMETQDNNWASNTTLDVGADFFVANRGSNTIVRMGQDGTVVAVRRVGLADGGPLGNARLNGIGASPDGSKIWVTATGPLRGFGEWQGAVLEVQAFSN